MPHGNTTVIDAITCRQLCEQYVACQVFSYQSGRCNLLRSLGNSTPAPISVTGATDAVSGAVPCGQRPILPFPLGLPGYGSTTDTSPATEATEAAATSTCNIVVGAVYGGGNGVCEGTQLLSVHAPLEYVYRGIAEAWWSRSIVTEENATLTVAECRARCTARTGSSPETTCGGFIVSAGICQLRSALSCSPKFGTYNSEAPSPPGMLVYGTVISGLVTEQCISPDEIAEDSIALEPIFFNCTLPRCTTPITTGTFIPDLQGTFIPDAPCRHEIYETPSKALNGLRGSWTAFLAGSNGLLTINALGNLLQPGLLGPYIGAADLRAMGIDSALAAQWLSFSRVGDMDVFDLVWEVTSGEGDDSGELVYNITHINGFKWGMVESMSGSSNGLWLEAREDTLKVQLARAPPSHPQSVRLTYINARYWSDVGRAHGVIETDAGWNTTAVHVVVQADMWYIYCGIFYLGFCDRTALQTLSNSELVAAYDVELSTYFSLAQSMCSSARAHCFIMTGAYIANYAQLRPTILSAVENTPWMDLLDLFGFNSLLPEETKSGHASQLVYTWLSNIFVSVVSSTPHQQSGCPTRVTAPWSCVMRSRSDASCQSCACPKCSSVGCSNERPWQCAAERQCIFNAYTYSPYEIRSVVTCSFRMGGGVSDFTEDDKSAIGTKVSTEVGTDSANVIVTVSAGSVLVTVDILVSSAPEANNVTATLNDEFASVAALQQFLGNGFSIEAVVDAPTYTNKSMLAARNVVYAPGSLSTEPTCAVELDLLADWRAATAAIEALNASANTTIMDPSGCQRLWCGTEQDGLILTLLALIACAILNVIYCIARSWGTRIQFDKLATSQTSAHLPGAAKPSTLLGWVLRRMTTAKPTPKGERLPGLNAARILASIHIVITHMYAQGATANVYIFSWGFTWVPWFFMLSGYVLTHAQLSRKKPAQTVSPRDEMLMYYVSLSPQCAFNGLLMFVASEAAMRFTKRCCGTGSDLGVCDEASISRVPNVRCWHAHPGPARHYERGDPAKVARACNARGAGARVGALGHRAVD